MKTTDLFNVDAAMLHENHDDVDDCRLCRGTGEGQTEHQRCPNCHGTGVQPVDRDYDDFDEPDDYDDDNYDEPLSNYERYVNSRFEEGVAEAEGDPEGLPHLTPKLAKHISQQIDTEGPHAVEKSIEWGDGAAEELLAKIKEMLDDYAGIANETAAWQKKSGKNKNGGLNQKGVDSYRREHPGSKLQTAVTKKPSELKAGSKDANRRKSFCARMGGMKGPMKDEHGKPTRKALALRKWHCESAEQFGQMIDEHISRLDVVVELREGLKNPKDNPCWKGYHPVGTKMKNGRKVPNCVPTEGVAEGSEQIYKVVALTKSNALAKPTKMKVKATSLEDLFSRLAANDWYPLEINGVEVIAGKRLKQGVAEEAGQIADIDKKKVHLIPAKNGLAQHREQWIGISPKQFARVPEQDRCSKCNELFTKLLRKQGMAEGLKDTIRGHNYARLANRAGKEADAAFNKTRQYTVPGQILNPTEADKEFYLKKKKQLDRKKKSDELLGKGVAEGSEQDEYHNRILKAIKVYQQDLRNLYKGGGTVKQANQLKAKIEQLKSCLTSGTDSPSLYEQGVAEDSVYSPKTGLDIDRSKPGRTIVRVSDQDRSPELGTVASRKQEFLDRQRKQKNDHGRKHEFVRGQGAISPRFDSDGGITESYYADMFEAKLNEFASCGGTGGIATSMAVGNPKAGSLFGGSYTNPSNPFAKKTKKRSGKMIKR